MTFPTPESLYRDHLDAIKRSADAALEATGHDHLVIAAGAPKTCFLDDRHYPFRPNPHFKHWVPLTDHPFCWIAYTPGARPVLAYYQPEDFWHLPPAAPSGAWVDQFDIRIVADPAEAAAHLPRTGRVAVIGEADAALDGALPVPNNPEGVLNRLHWRRATKTPWELSQMRQASRVAVAGHLAARAAFLDGASELGIHRAYLAATGHSDISLPYGNIVGLNEHGAVLHYQYQQAQAPAEHRSLLIDAGAEVAGYASDITRTWGNGDADFEALVTAVDRVQLALVDGVRAGADYGRLHIDAHHRLAGVLADLGIVRMAPEAMVDQGVSASFFPHGLGHLIGLQVHDVGGFQAGPDGGRIERPEGHPYLRLTRPLEAGMVVTIEPGIYFIDAFLQALRAGPHAVAVDWAKVDHLRRFGGVRIEDDVACTSGAPENLTRDAFAAAA